MAWSDWVWANCEKCKYRELCHKLPENLTCKEVAQIAEVWSKDGDNDETAYMENEMG